MSRSLVIGNWKMFGSLDFNHALIEDLADAIEQDGADSLANVVVAVCPSSVYLTQVLVELDSQELPILLGAQNVCAEKPVEGAYTGEVSAAMLADLNVVYALVGHSERRDYYQEGNDIVLNKFKQLQAQGVTPVLCIGETLEQREAGQTLAVIEDQLMSVLSVVEAKALENMVVAYEPVWAIGTGKTASPEQAQEVHAFIRQLLSGLGSDVAEKTSILYGGSVKSDNAQELFAQQDIDGGLVGGASLKAEQFLAICKAASAQ